MRNLFNTSPSRVIAASALLVFAGFACVAPAQAQGLVPGYTLTAPKGTVPGANARGIKDNGVKNGTGVGGVRGSRRVKRQNGSNAQGKTQR